MKLVQRLLLGYLLLKPFYLFSSGGVQIADLLLILAFAVYFIASRFNKDYWERFVKSLDSNTYLIVFVFCVFVINLMYFLIFREFRFLLSTVYFIFNLLAVILFSDFGKNKVFLSKVGTVLKLNLLIQLAISVLGAGRNYDAIRYMSTFNDPNQFAFYVLVSYLLIYVIQTVLARKNSDLPYLMVALYLIFLSASTGNLLGLLVFIVLRIAHMVVRDHKITLKRLRAVFISLSIGLITVTLAAAMSKPATIDRVGDNTKSVIETQSVIERLSNKASKTQRGAEVSIWEDRGLDIIYRYPHYILFGAGEGGYTRYHKVTHNYGGEVHSTLPSMLFYYGIFPFIILALWFYKKIKCVDGKILIAYIALLVESLSLINQRQSLFWIIFVIGGLYATSQVKNKKRREA